jgi:hypothetical protein
MDKLLISGDGKGNSAIRFWCIVYALMAIAGGAMMYYASTHSQVSIGRNFNLTVANPEAGKLYYIGLIILVSAFICAIALSYCITKTKINVYENYIEGIGVGRYFLWGDLRTKSFKLAYDQITSFDTTSSAITIVASSVAYSCYVSNASEIQGTIFNQKQLNEKAKTTGESK